MTRHPWMCARALGRSMAVLALVLALPRYSVPPAFADIPPRMHVVLNTVYFNETTQDNEGEKVIEGFLKLALERTFPVDVYTGGELSAVCTTKGDKKCQPDAWVTATVMESKEEVRLYARSILASGKNQPRGRGPVGAIVARSQLPSGLAKLVEQIVAAIDPHPAFSGTLDMNCLETPTPAAKNIARQLRSAVAVRLRSSRNIAPSFGSDEAQTCVTPRFDLAENAKAGQFGEAGRAWLRTAVTVSGDQYKIALTLWRDSAATPYHLPVITSDAKHLSDDPSSPIARKISVLLRGLLGRYPMVIQNAQQSNSQSLSLENARGALIENSADYDTAFACFELALWDNEDAEATTLDYAKALASRSEFKTAQDILGRARDRHESAALDLAYAQTLSRGGDTAGALKIYARMQEHNLSPEEVAEGIVRAHSVAGEWEAARRAVNEGMAAFPRSIPLILLAGQIEEAQSNPQAAIAAYQRGLSLPTSANQAVKSSLAALYVRMAAAIRDRDAAGWQQRITLLTMSLGLEPTTVAYYRRAYSASMLNLMSSDDSADARTQRTLNFMDIANDYRQAVNLSGSNPLGQYPWATPNLIEAEIISGQFKLARKDAREFLPKLTNGAKSQTPVSLQNLRAVTALLSAVAAILDGGRQDAEKELYLQEFTPSDGSPGQLQWSFDSTLKFLDDFGKSHPELIERQQYASDLINTFENQ